MTKESDEVERNKLLAEYMPFLASIIHLHYVDKFCDNPKPHGLHDHGTGKDFFRCPGIRSGGTRPL